MSKTIQNCQINEFIQEMSGKFVFIIKLKGVYAKPRRYYKSQKLKS